MGTYLSTPASEKYKEWGENMDCPVQPLRFCVVDMQGWRKSMEDAHVVEMTVPYPPALPYLKGKKKEEIPGAKVFGVFDGHGGPEVARFCQLYLVSVLTKQEVWQGEPQSEAEEGTEENATNSSPEGANSAENTGIGKALIESFHALDRLIDDPSRRDEIIRLRTQKAPPTERRDVGIIPPVKPIAATVGAGIVKVTDLMAGDAAVAAANVLPPPPPPAAPQDPADNTEEKERKNDTDAATEETTAADTKTKEKAGEEEESLTESTTSIDSASDENSESSDSTSPTDGTTAETATASAASTEEPEEEQREDGKAASKADEEYDSDEAVGKEEATRDQNLDEDDDSNDDVQINPYDGAVQVVDNSADENAATDPAVPANKVTVMFQRLLNMNDQSGQMVIRVAGDDADKADGTNSADQVQAPVHTGPSAASPSILQNGRLICNLPDHPIHAGCTAVVAVLLGMTLTVANAGDSRGVLCREGGITEALSYDHKPQQPREMNRINNAGGFVNRFGRVNGNLNLSRSIGDLKYKQVPGIAPADQMITAEPDILQVTLNPKDEFFILGCDGIWDCLTNEKAVEFVRERIDTKEPNDICEEMLNAILSDDPRATQGIGGDNMTIMIVDLQPSSRSYTVDPAWGPESSSAL